MTDKVSNPPNLLWRKYYTSWITDVDTGFRDGLHAFVYYGGYSAVGERMPKMFRDGVEPWKADSIRDLSIHDGGSCFGLQMELPHRDIVFEIGRTYLMEFPFATAPDLITVNGLIMWRRGSCASEKDIELAKFAWQADAPKALIRFLVARADGEIRFVSQEEARPGVYVNADLKPTAGMGKFELPAGVSVFEMKPYFRQWLDWNTARCPWPRAVPKVTWPTDPVGIIIDVNGIGQYSFHDQLGNFQHFLRCHKFGATGIDGIFYWPMGGWPPQYAGFWPHEPIPGDITPAEMDRFMEKNKIRHVILEWCQFGEWFHGKAWDFPDPSRNYYPPVKYFEGIDRANIIMTRYSDVDVHLWVAEFRLPGAWNDPRNRIQCGKPEDAKLWSNPDGLTVTYGLWEKWDKLLDGNRDWQEKTRACMKDPRRSNFAIQSSSPFTAAAGVRGGADVIDTKTIHRQNVQCFVAAGRGCARSAGVKLQLELDSYHSNSYNTLGPDEVEQIYKVFFASGADMIYAQADLFAIDERKQVVPNQIGEAALRAVRRIRIHPRRGRQTATSALLQGDGTHFNFAPDSIQTRDGLTQRLQRRPEQLDFEAATCFVPKMGHWWRCNYQHMFSGTPYGPFDIAPAEHGLKCLGQYRLAAMMGWHGMTIGQFREIESFAGGGGKFFCAIGHLRVRGEGDWEKNGRPLAADPSGLFGVKIGVDGVPEIIDSEIVARDVAGKPLVTRKGSAYLVWRETLQMLDADADNSSVLNVLSRLAEESRVIRLDPPNDYLEAVFSERDGLLFVNLFNHGRIRQPSGIGPETEIWRGRVRIDGRVTRFAGDSLDAVRLTDTMRAVRTPLKSDGGWLCVQARIDRHVEYVIGTADAIRDKLFS
ncbi:MAG: hypothetical protein WAX69_13135 [Victivallales bacterium]